MIYILLKVVTIFLLLAKQGSSFTALMNTNRLSHSNGRKLTTCTGGFVLNACAGCCGYKFASKTALQTAVNGYPANQGNYSEMKCWDVSDITDMSYLFYFKGLDEPIGCWNVSKITNMEGMFESATAFNQDIGNWYVRSVTNMKFMFSNAANFNQTIINWNVSKVTNMAYMFNGATKFNQTIGNWDVGKVTTMEYMFKSATKFNQDLCAWYNKLLSLPTVTNMFISSGCTNQALPNVTSKTSFCQACTCSGGKFLFVML